MTEVIHVIRGWRFDPREAVLRRDGDERRLETRAARTLQLLCERRGEVVSKDELIAAVWAGRAVSPNSVAIVIGSLRRALGDDPRAPDLLCTVPRRGYRLVEEAPEDPTAVLRRPRRAWLVIGMALTAAVTAWVWRPTAAPLDLVVEPCRNDTGRAALDGLARALSPVVVDAALRLHGVRVLTASPPLRADVRRLALRPRLILWNDAPEVALTATDASNGAVLWSGFAPGPPSALARHTATRVAALQRRLPP